ncbi:MAG: hypothetical protein CMN76_00435 [Spirochaetaceae bacterium]|nr:hypothetical protein [Spirochaetaceae bacterium]|tara:strand:+ start:45615 stop:46544 length:930 start_codon:yes stop_codon:yes gene_type:complete
MKYRNKLLAVAFTTVFASSVHAESYLGLGAGLQFDLGQLTNTIVLDGLESSVGNASLNGVTRLQGCGTNTACQTEVRGNNQDLIISERNLDALDKSTTGFLFDNDLRGGMTGLQLTAFYESEGDNTFWRLGVMYTKKIMGGHTESRLMGFKWLDQKWDYYAWQVPFYYGFKTGIGESASVYAGAGLHYFNGGWNVGGYVLGDVPTYLLGTATGPHTVLDANTGAPKGGNVIGEAVRFRVNGLGFNFLIGVEKKMSNGDKLYFEIDRAYSGGMGNARAESQAGQQGLAPFPSYPIAIGGWSYRFGYKMKL